MLNRTYILDSAFISTSSNWKWIGIALGYGLDNRGSRVRIPAESGNFSLHHRVQNGSGAHSASYAVGTRGFFLGIKRPGRKADHSPPSSAEVKEWVEPYLHSPNSPSWRGAQLKHRDNFTFTFTCSMQLVNKFTLLHLPASSYCTLLHLFPLLGCEQVTLSGFSFVL
jgi:hypothetical protein